MNRNTVAAVGAAVLVAGPAGEFAWALVWPSSPALPAADAVSAVAAHPAAASAGLWLDLLILLIIPGALFIGRALGAAERPLAAVGSAVMFTGALLQTYSLANDVVLVAAAHAHSPAVASGFQDSAVVTLTTFGGLLLQFGGSVMLGISALSSRAVPRWAGILFLVWLPLQAAGTALGLGWLAAGAFLLLLLLSSACAVRLLRAPAAPRERTAESRAPELAR